MRVTGTHDVRTRLLDATVELLRERGLQGTTPAAVADRAGASKMSLYRHFAGIDELVVTALAEFDQPHRDYLMGDPGQSPRQRLETMFSRAAAKADADGSYRGCLYVAASLAEPDLGEPTIGVSAEHKRQMIASIARLLAEAGDPTPEATAEVIQILMDGALVHASLHGSGEPLRAAAAALPRLAPAVFGPAAEREVAAANLT